MLPVECNDTIKFFKVFLYHKLPPLSDVPSKLSNSRFHIYSAIRLRAVMDNQLLFKLLFVGS